MTDYEPFDLLVTQGAGGYQARVVRSQAGDASVDFKLPVADGETFLWRAPGVARPAASGGQPAAPMTPDQFGRLLYEAAFAGEVGVRLQQSLTLAQSQGAGLRIRLRFDRELAALADLPWEYLYSPALGRYLALSDDTPLVRYLEVGHGAQPLPVRPPLAVVAVLANPSDVTQLAVDQEWERLQEAVRPLRERKLLRLERLPSATVEALQGRLRQAPVHVLHFVGHGYFDERRNQGGLIFEDEQGRARPVPAENLGIVLHDHESLRLAFLNACEGASSGRSDSFAGVAQYLIRQGVPAVLAMQFPVSDRAAVALSQEFYRALTDGYPVDAAVSEARKAMAVQGESLEWGTPVLFSRSDDNRLIELPEGDARPVIEIQPWEPETVLIGGGPFLMGSQSGEGISIHETEQHEVDLPDFRIGRYPVTNRQYGEFLRRQKAHDAPRSWFLREPPADRLDHPVTEVSWHDAFAYCDWLRAQTGRHYRLPSEAEWEKAASWDPEAGSGERGAGGQEKRIYPWSNEWVEGRCNVGGEGTTPVDAFPQGAGAYGVEDLLGNVQEWTRTVWGLRPQEPDYGYPYDPGDGREVIEAGDLPAQARMVHRGGSFKSRPEDLRCTARSHADPASRIAWRGFRVAVEIEVAT